jgi:hypothetical protein
MSELHPHKPQSETELREAAHEHDDWFRHAPDEPHHQVAHGEFNAKLVIACLVFTCVFTFGVAIIVIPWFKREVQSQKIAVQETSQRVVNERDEAYSAWTQELYGEPDWINQGEGTVSLPLPMAKGAVMEEYDASRLER